jgi:hypothetical protein
VNYYDIVVKLKIKVKIIYVYTGLDVLENPYIIKILHIWSGRIAGLFPMEPGTLVIKSLSQKCLLVALL